MGESPQDSPRFTRDWGWQPLPDSPWRRITWRHVRLVVCLLLCGILLWQHWPRHAADPLFGYLPADCRTFMTIDVPGLYGSDALAPSRGTVLVPRHLDRIEQFLQLVGLPWSDVARIRIGDLDAERPTFVYELKRPIDPAAVMGRTTLLRWGKLRQVQEVVAGRTLYSLGRAACGPP